MGLFTADATPHVTVSQRALGRRLVDAQERIVEHAARSWNAYEAPPGRVLDIGCGLGGAALYWAQEHGASVTGLTVAAEHVPIIQGFARRAGVEDKVDAVPGNVHDLDASRVYDAAYANESSGYTDRARLFEVVAKALKPGGWFGIQEHFVCRPEWRDFVDGYYRTRLGTRTEYLAAAEAAGFGLERDEDVTDAVAEFWLQSMAWNTAELDRLRAGGRGGSWSRERLGESTIAHSKLFRIWRDHALETRLLLFRLGGADGHGTPSAPPRAPPASARDCPPSTARCRRASYIPRRSRWRPARSNGWTPSACTGTRWSGRGGLATHSADFSCRLIPEGDVEALLLFTEWNYWANAIDDWQDSGAAEVRTAAVVDHGARLVRTLQDPGAALLPDSAVTRALADLVRRTHALLTPFQLRRFVEGTRDWLLGAAWQAAGGGERG
ncbi:hypothetical protein GCM10020254_78680 [Streptomyces goshikiensis]